MPFRRAVVNAFNILEIIELFNLLYASSFAEKKESENNNDDRAFPKTRLVLGKALEKAA
jgi:hypothetical protein